ncbi:MAG: DNA-formamidopyrimidine glycosylase [Acidobacteriales bacterium 13_1_40CM_3_55_5]|nr:MAG: DNA-formamidopyrimidine glycosylase [Acidobacteriales bacterium 13_1_40CM_3_55_5]PYX10956.1 MAG: bifunctional DNA-formamidopyrimidine glycosylase/DNA-(apurinic or apyrimidinic site) lyase [Acidobacteriota bacterium]
MPELPEVETIARGLASRLTGDFIESVWLGSKPEPLKSSAAEIAATLQSRRIADVRRMGKHIVFELVSTRGRRSEKRVSAKAQWIVHLGMTGSMLVCKPELEIAKHTHAVVKLASGRELRFVDPRRFGRLSVARDFDAVGCEPLDVKLDRFITLFHGRKTPIKSALLNQKLLRGVGNIYADESLFRAGIRPRRRAASLTRENLRRLYKSVQEVLKEAIALGGSSVSDYVDSDGQEGSFQLEHRVYGREGERCLSCKAAIKRIVIAGRSSHYCPKCQT